MPMQDSTDDSSTADPVSPGLMRRFSAMGYDSLLLMAIALAYGALATLVNVLIQGQPVEGKPVYWGEWRLLVFVGLVSVLVGFYCYFWRRSGQTLGMRAWHLKLVDRDLKPPSLKQCLVRCLIAPFSLAAFGMGYFWLWLDPDRQTLHGRLSGTRVIQLPKERKPEHQPGN